MVAAMNTSYDAINIDDLASLARETCVYRGRAQSTKQSMVAAAGYTRTKSSRFGKLLALFKRYFFQLFT
jgi:hypothetical protein